MVQKKINDYLKIKNITEFEETSSEKGIIPMFFAEEKNSRNPNIFNIGIRGGACKHQQDMLSHFL